MKRLLFAVAAVDSVRNRHVQRTRTGTRTAGAAGERRPLRQQPGCRKNAVPAGCTSRQGQQRETDPACGRAELGSLQSGHVEIRIRLRSARRRQGVESGEAQDDGRPEGDRRHGVQLDRPGDLLRDGERRLRLHLDRDAARRSRLGGGRAHVAHLPERESRARRARRLHRRARDSARARRRRAGRRGADGGYGRRGHRRAQLDVLPAARPAQQRRRSGVRSRDVRRGARRISPDHQRQHRPF